MMMEKLCVAAQEALRLGLLSPTMARQLVRLPAGNQQGALETGRRHSLSAAELRGVVDLLLASGTREKAAFVLERPREALREAQAGEVRGWDQAQKVLTLLGIYRREDLLAALERAVRYGAFSAKSIERILAVQARPKTCWDRMAEEELSHLGELLSDDPTPPRPATDYQHLLFEESDHDFEAWSEYLGDPPLAMAFLDRIVDGAILLKIRGKSYRAHRAKKPTSAAKADAT